MEWFREIFAWKKSKGGKGIGGIRISELEPWLEPQVKMEEGFWEASQFSTRV